MKYNVFSGEYPFNNKLGQVNAEDANTALYTALQIYGGHCVVESLDKKPTQENNNETDE